MSLALLKRLLRYLRRRILLDDQRGMGRPVPVESLDREYSSGAWNHFFGDEEKVRYDALLSLTLARTSRHSVLDVGCGSGRLARMFSEAGIPDYLGLDLSREGLARARALQLGKYRFVEGNFESLVPEGDFDVIVFNESISYASNPRQVAERFAQRLRPGGVLLVSLLQFGNHPAVWRSLEKSFSSLQRITVRNDKGLAWDIAVFAPKS